MELARNSTTVPHANKLNNHPATGYESAGLWHLCSGLLPPNINYSRARPKAARMNVCGHTLRTTACPQDQRQV